jgi:hypothetical protein
LGINGIVLTGGGIPLVTDTCSPACRTAAIGPARRLRRGQSEKAIEVPNRAGASKAPYRRTARTQNVAGRLGTGLCSEKPKSTAIEGVQTSFAA